jgi:hypothetical protein
MAQSADYSMLSLPRHPPRTAHFDYVDGLELDDRVLRADAEAGFFAGQRP